MLFLFIWFNIANNTATSHFFLLGTEESGMKKTVLVPFMSFSIPCAKRAIPLQNDFFHVCDSCPLTFHVDNFFIGTYFFRGLIYHTI